MNQIVAGLPIPLRLSVLVYMVCETFGVTLNLSNELIEDVGMPCLFRRMYSVSPVSQNHRATSERAARTCTVEAVVNPGF